MAFERSSQSLAPSAISITIFKQKMTGYIGCLGLITIFAFIVMLSFWSRGKRREVGEFYKKYSLIPADNPPALARQLIGAANTVCLKGSLTVNSGDVVPFYWWEWSTSSTNYGGAAPITSINPFLAISFPPNTVSPEFERQAGQELQSNQNFSQKLKNGISLNTRDPIRIEKPADGSFVIFWQILQRAEIMEEKINWLKSNLSINRELIAPIAPVIQAAPVVQTEPTLQETLKSEVVKTPPVQAIGQNVIDPPFNILEPTFYENDDYPTLRVKFSGAWKNLDLELHHDSAVLQHEGWDEFASDATFGDPNSLPKLAFALTGETTAGEAISLFSEHYGGKAYILRGGNSVEERESLAYCNNPFRLPLNEFTYREFKRRFKEHWPNLSIEIFDASPRNGGLWRNSKELADDFEMKNLKNADRAYLHDYIYISTWGDSLKNVQVAGAIKNDRLGTYAEGNLANTKLKDFQAMEKT